MVGVMRSVAEDEAKVIGRLGQRGGDPEVAGEEVELALVPAVVAVLHCKEDAKRLPGSRGDQVRVGVAFRHLHEAG